MSRRSAGRAEARLGLPRVGRGASIDGTADCERTEYTMPPHTAETYAGLAVSCLHDLDAARVAVADPDVSLTGHQMLSRIAALQRFLRSVSPSGPRRLAMLSTNRVDAWAMQIAAMGLGACVVWLHPRGSLADHLRIVEDAMPDMLVVDPGAPSGCAADLVRAFSPKGPALGMTRLPGTHELPPIDLNATESRVTVACSPDDIGLLNYTGGTTGTPKAVIRTHGQWASIARAAMDSYGMPAGCRFLAVGPISHVTGTALIPALLAGGTVYLLPVAGPAQVLAAIERWEIDTTLLVPTAINALLNELDSRSAHVPRLRKLFWGGSAMAREQLERAWERLGPVLHQVYGQTEAYPLCGMPPDALQEAVAERSLDHRWRSCGFPVPGVEIELRDGDGAVVSEGDIGEITVRGPQVTPGYLRAADEVAPALVNGWLRTGDLARRHPDGCLEIVGRSKDMVITGGFNVYSREVESALESHPEVKEAAVYGTPHPKWGEAVTASVVCEPGSRVSVEELVAWVGQQKGSYQAPKRIELLEELPTTSLGKVDKESLRRRWAAS